MPACRAKAALASHITPLAETVTSLEPYMPSNRDGFVWHRCSKGVCQTAYRCSDQLPGAQVFRESGGRARVWGAPPKKLAAQYTTGDGTQKTALLLLSGAPGPPSAPTLSLARRYP
jgi:hypothetical protein